MLIYKVTQSLLTVKQLNDIIRVQQQKSCGLSTNPQIGGKIRQAYLDVQECTSMGEVYLFPPFFV